MPTSNKKFWIITFYIVIAVDLLFFGVIIYFYKNKQLAKDVSIALSSIAMAVLTFTIFLYSLFNEEACISGHITVKKSKDTSLYWFMTLFWAICATVSIGYAFYFFAT